MSDKIKLQDIADFCGGEINGDPLIELSGAAPIDSASSSEIALARTKAYMKMIPESKAGAFIVPEKPDTDVNCIVHPNPYACFARVVSIFHPLEPKKEGVDSTAVTGDNFKCGDSVHIGANSVVGDDVEIGNNCVIYPGVVIGNKVKIGSGTRIYPNVTVYSGTEIGERVIIHSSSVIGSDGFGFAPDETGWVKIHHQGRVVIGNDVEIGASNTIDRGTFGDTIIFDGVKTDNHVHIAHNVSIGEKTILVGQSGIAGSTKVGKNCIIAGKAGISGHLEIGDNVIIGPMSGVTGNIKSGSVVSGYPSVSHSLWLKVLSVLPRLPELRKKIVSLEKKIKKLEEK